MATCVGVKRRQRGPAAVVHEQVVHALRRGNGKPDLAQTLDQQVALLAVALDDTGEERPRLAQQR